MVTLLGLFTSCCHSRCWVFAPWLVLSPLVRFRLLLLLRWSHVHRGEFLCAWWVLWCCQLLSVVGGGVCCRGALLHASGVTGGIWIAESGASSGVLSLCCRCVASDCCRRGAPRVRRCSGRSPLFRCCCTASGRCWCDGLQASTPSVADGLRVLWDLRLVKAGLGAPLALMVAGACVAVLLRGYPSGCLSLGLVSCGRAGWPG